MIRLHRRHLPLLASLLALVLLYGAASLRYPVFFSADVIFGLFYDNAVLGILAIGMTFVILSGGIDLSVGAIMSLSSVVLGVLLMKSGWPLFAAMALTLSLGTFIGAGMGGMIHLTGIKPFIITLAGMFFARGLGYLIHEEPITIQHEGLQRLSEVGAYPFQFPAFIFLAVVILGAFLGRQTSFGRNVYALGGSEEASLLMGLPMGRLRVMIYALSGFCSALGGIVLTLIQPSGSHIEGVAMELEAIAAVVIGGTLLTGGVGSVTGTLMGVLIIGVIYQIMTFESVGAGLNKTVLAGLLLLFVLLQKTLSGRSAEAGG